MANRYPANPMSGQPQPLARAAEPGTGLPQALSQSWQQWPALRSSARGFAMPQHPDIFPESGPAQAVGRTSECAGMESRRHRYCKATKGSSFCLVTAPGGRLPAGPSAVINIPQPAWPLASRWLQNIKVPPEMSLQCFHGAQQGAAFQMETECAPYLSQQPASKAHETAAPARASSIPKQSLAPSCS